MSSSTTCHLSGLSINEGEIVVALPIRYSEVLNPSTLIYQSNSAVFPFWLPIEGRYAPYGNMTQIDDKSASNVMFLKFLNDHLLKKDKKIPALLSHGFCAFQDERGIPEQGEFISQESAKNKLDNKEIVDICGFRSLTEFVSLVSNRALFDYNGKTFNRVGLIFIKKSILSAFSEKNQNLKSALSEIESSATEYFSSKKTAWEKFKLARKQNVESDTLDDLMDEANMSEDYILNNILGMFNGSRDICHSLRRELSTTWFEAGIDIDSLVHSTTLFASIEQTYQRLGKSYYPNVYRPHNMSGVIDMAKVIIEETKKIERKNKKYFKECGYDINDPDDLELYNEDFKYRDWR